MSAAVEELDAATLSPFRREMNKVLMVAWINADLLNRAQHDVRKSIVLYDEDNDFLHAVEELPDEAMLHRLRAETPVRYWSRGL